MRPKQHTASAKICATSINDENKHIARALIYSMTVSPMLNVSYALVSVSCEGP